MAESCSRAGRPSRTDVPRPPRRAGRWAAATAEWRAGRRPTRAGAAGRVRLVLADGGRVLLRPLRPTDGRHVARWLAGLSPQSRYQRFLSPTPRLPAWQRRYLTAADQRDHVAWLALARETAGWAVAGIARWVRLPDEPGAAELALAVVDRHQGRGLGRVLAGVLGVAALEGGVGRLRAQLLGENRRMARLLLGAGAVLRPADGLLAAEVDPSRLAARLAPAGVRASVARLARRARSPADTDAAGGAEARGLDEGASVLSGSQATARIAS